MIKTTEYFNMAIDELLVVNKESEWTREECKIYDDGVQIAWYDSEKEMVEDEENLQQYLDRHDLCIKQVLLTINERIAVVIF